MDENVTNLSDLKSAVQRAEHSVALFQKTNRLRLASLVDRESQISARRERLASSELESKLIIDRQQQDLEMNRDLESEIDALRRKIARITARTRAAEQNEISISKQIRTVSLPELRLMKQRFLNQKAEVHRIQQRIDSLPRIADDLDSRRLKLERRAASQKGKLAKLHKRIGDLKSILQIPVDDLRLEALTVERLEDSIPKPFTDSVNLLEASLVKSERKVLQIEHSNSKRSTELRTKRSTLAARSPKRSPLPKARERRAVTPGNGTEEDERFRMTQVSSSLDLLRTRYTEIDKMEQVTNALQEDFLEERQQIEDSWDYKLDDLKAFQQRATEVDSLLLATDELGERVSRLRIVYDNIHHLHVTKIAEKNSISLRLDQLYELHPQLESRIARIREKKLEIASRERNLQQKTNRADRFRIQIDSLENDIRRRNLALENVLNDLEETKARATQMSPQAEAREFPTTEDFSGSDDERTENREPFSDEQTIVPPFDDDDDDIAQVIRDAQEAIALPLLRSQFKMDV
jgi:hypothetical protein